MEKQLRKLIRKIINETVADPGTIFGPYHDEVVLSKEKIKPQYFSIALKRANKICSDPEISNQEINCPVDYEIEKTPHSSERQYRHIESTIQDEQIKAVVNRGIDKLIKLLLSNAIQLGDKLHLKDKNSDLNIILTTELESKNENETIIRFPIITVMKKSNFATGFDTKGPFVT